MSILSWFKKKIESSPESPKKPASQFMPNEFEFTLSDPDKLRHFFKLYDDVSTKKKLSLFEYWKFIEECVDEQIREFAKSNDYYALKYILSIKLDGATFVTITAKFLRNDT
jgi:hypothetical protein